MQKNNFILLLALLSIATLSQAFLGKGLQKHELQFVEESDDVWEPSKDRLGDIKQALYDAPSDSIRTAILKTLTADFAFKASLISELLESYSSDDNKLEALDLFENRCIDPEDAEDYKDTISKWDKCDVVDVASDKVRLPSKAWKKSEIKDLVEKIRKEDHGVKRLEIAKKEIEDSDKQITTEQLIDVFDAIKGSIAFDSLSGLCDESTYYRSDIQKFVLGWTINDGMAQILDSIKFKIVDPFNKYTLITSFDYSQIIDDIIDVFKKVKPTDSVFGNTKGLKGVKNIVFVIDTSESMETTFETASGKTISRLEAIQNELSRTLKTLTEENSFNIVSYYDQLNIWKDDLVKATKEHISDAIDFANGLTSGGATNINYALSTAYDYKDVDYIYFLTDGVPTDGETNIDNILDNVKDWYKKTKAPIQAIAFLEGDFEYDDKPGSRKLMSELAKITKGNYIDSSSEKKSQDEDDE